MKKTILQIKAFIKKGEDWAKTTSKHYCFLHLDPETNTVTVRRWGMLSKPNTDSAYYWIKLNLKDPKLDERIDTAIQKWSDRMDLSFDLLKSGYPPVAERRTYSFSLYR